VYKGVFGIYCGKTTVTSHHASTEHFKIHTSITSPMTMHYGTLMIH